MISAKEAWERATERKTIDTAAADLLRRCDTGVLDAASHGFFLFAIRLDTLYCGFGRGIGVKEAIINNVINKLEYAYGYTLTYNNNLLTLTWENANEPVQ